MAAISSLVLSETMPKNDRIDELDTPTTPRATRYDPPPPLSEPAVGDARPTTSPRSASSTSPAFSRPLDHAEGSHHGHKDDAETRSNEEAISTSMDLDDDDPDARGSDNDTEQGDGDSSRKKKGQRFFCTGYPPCNLHFTRSEHLARHIRKHTGERPFQCHCNRRFSRLDNLRQHAQTVHVNEEIPNDSLAATGTRFQRQIRTDRVRPSGRPRTGTAGSAGGGHSRGHSRNLSASSIGSTSSNYSIVADTKRRPPPLLMANDGPSRPILGIEPPQTPPSQYRGYNPHSPADMSTPTSAHYSATPGSPGFLSSMGSPGSTHSRPASYYGARPPARRLSVPSGSSPYQSQYPPGYPLTYVNNTMGPPSSHASSSSSVYGSPTSGTFPVLAGPPVPAGEDWRRRTWHSSTFSTTGFNYGRPATSGLTYSQTPDAPQPAHAPHATAAAGQAPRLPGIESFDHVQHRPNTPPRRQPSPMQVDPSPPDYAPHPDSRPRPGHVSWEGPRPSQYPDLDDATDRSQPAGSWGQQAINEISQVGARHRDGYRPAEMGPPAPAAPPTQYAPPVPQEPYDAQSATRRTKRQGWYNGPLATRTSPEDSSSSDGIPTPGLTAVEVHPMIMHSSGYMEPQPTALPPDGPQNVCLGPSPYIEPGRRQPIPPFNHHDHGSRGGQMNRLEALVAVATSGQSSAR